MKVPDCFNIEKIFAELEDNKSPLSDIYGGKKILVFAVADWVDTGYMIATVFASMGFGISAKTEALLRLGSGQLLTGKQHFNCMSPASLFIRKDERKNQLPQDDCLFVFPENDLVARQEIEFVDKLCKAQGGKRIIIITTSSVILTDFTCEHVKVVECSSELMDLAQGGRKSYRGRGLMAV